MRAIEKIWFIVEQINEARGISPARQPCILQDRPLHNVLTPIGIDSILEKLEKDEKVIKIIQNLTGF